MDKELRRLISYMLRHWPLYFAVAAGIIATSGIDVFGAWFAKRMIDCLVYQRDMALFIKLGFMAAAVFLIGEELILYIRRYFQVAATKRTIASLRQDLFARLHRLPLGFLHRLGSGQLSSRLSNDLSAIEETLGNHLIYLVEIPLRAVVAVTYIFLMDWRFALACGLVGPLSVAAGHLFGRRMRETQRSIQDNLGALNQAVIDSLRSTPVIRAFSLESMLERRFVQLNRRFCLLWERIGRLQGGLVAFGEFISSLPFMLSYAVGGYLVLQGSMSVGTLLAAQQLLNRLTWPFTNFANVWAGTQSCLGAVERVGEVLSAQPEDTAVSEGAGLSRPCPMCAVEFRDVSFAYPGSDRAVLNRLNFTIRSGERVALVGRSGAGKSTLLYLLLGLYPPTKGQILLHDRSGSTSVARAPQLRAATSYAPQEPYLLPGTIEENVTWGRPDSTAEEVARALALAGATDFARRRSTAADASLGEEGTGLSRGQKQRVSLARALVKDSPILVLDEATASLDIETETQVHAALLEASSHRALLVVAHRLSTIRLADRILMLEEGTISEEGQYQELMERRGAFFHLVQGATWT